MGLKRTMFGRHTNHQKSKYNARGTDLSNEIRNLFGNLQKELIKAKENVQQAEHANFPRLFSRNGFDVFPRNGWFQAY